MKDEKKKLTTKAGAPVVDNQNTMTAGHRGPALLQDVWFLEKLAILNVRLFLNDECMPRDRGLTAPLP